MRSVIFSMTVSLDGYVADREGGLDWGEPDAELHRFHGEQTRELDVQLLGRRLYETMLYWESFDPSGAPPEYGEWAEVWLPLPKIVFSRTLSEVVGNATLKRDGLIEEVKRLKSEPGKDIAVGGPALASSLIAAGLVDDYRLFVSPVVLGGGTPFFPPLERPLPLELVESRGFNGGVTYLRYRAA